MNRYDLMDQHGGNKERTMIDALILAGIWLVMMTIGTWFDTWR